MGQTRYGKAKEFLRKLLNQGYDVIHATTLRKEIMINLGADEHQTIRPYIKMMLATGLMKDTQNGFEINKKEVLQ